MPLVFVYGTLMRGGANHRVLERLGASFVAAARTAAPRTLVDLGPYPALLPATTGTGTAVFGEVWSIDARGLVELDAFEGCPDLYLRERITLATDKGALDADVYVLARRPPARARVIEGGRYALPGTLLPAGAAAEPIDTPSVLLDNPAPTEDGSRSSPRRGGPR